MERDNLRVKDGRERVWMRANAALCTKYLWRNGGAEDFATMIRLAYDKRWGTSIHNGEVCKACGGPAMGQKHPLFLCQNAEVIQGRNEWKESIEGKIDSERCVRIKSMMEEIWYNIHNSEGGAFACVGMFREDWVARLGSYGKLNKAEQRSINKRMREIVSGGRDLLRTYARIREVSVGTAKEPRQTSILTAVRMMSKKKKSARKRSKEAVENREKIKCNPSIKELSSIEIDGFLRWKWDLGKC